MMGASWTATIQSIKDSVPGPQFQRWFQELTLIRSDDKSICLGVPSRFHEDWLKANYTKTINEAIQQNFGSGLQLEFEICIQDSNLEASSSPLLTPPTIVQKPILRVLEGGGMGDSAKQEEKQSAPHETNLPVFNGELFELDFNRMALQCSELFSDIENSQVNPLVIVGAVGMGKTHYLVKIGEAFADKYPHLKVRYTNAEKFTNEILMSWKDTSGPDFRRQYRDDTDVLLFDDIQGIAGRRHTQEQLLHIFNEILARGGRVVFTSGVQPSKLKDFLDPLRSRLFAGITAEVRNPTYEERLSLLSLVAQQNQIAVEEAVLRLIADQPQQDVRELLGNFLRLHLQSKLEGKHLDTTYLAREGVTAHVQCEEITMNEIVALVENTFGISRTDLLGRNRKDLIAWARQVAMYLGRRFTRMSLEDIGKVFGRNHSTVLHAYEKVNETLDAHPSRRYQLEFLIQKLQARAPKSPDDDCPL